jgi:hypothetical protein
MAYAASTAASSAAAAAECAAASAASSAAAAVASAAALAASSAAAASSASRSADQGLPLVHFSVQPEPFLTQNTPYTPRNTPIHHLNTPSLIRQCTTCPTESAHTLSRKVDECKPLPPTRTPRRRLQQRPPRPRRQRRPQTRGLHSSTFQLNISAFCGIGGALRGCLASFQEVAGGMRRWLGCILCQKRLRLS